MILYFSGNGNTRHAALRIAEHLGEQSVAINKTDAAHLQFEGQTLGIMFPVYSWGVPPVMMDFIDRLSESFIDRLINDNIPVWVCATCGDETGLAHKMAASMLARRGIELKGSWSVIMPNTYVLLPGFDVDNKELERKKIADAEDRISHISHLIAAADWQTDVTVGKMAWLKSCVVFPLFRRFGIYPSKWRYTEACTKCGLCSSKCPVGNITIGKAGPEWGKNCTSCLACYNYCPVHAIEYGKITKGKHHYHYPEK